MHRLSFIFHHDQLSGQGFKVEGGSGRHRGRREKDAGGLVTQGTQGTKGSRRQSLAGQARLVKLGTGPRPPGMCGRGWWMEASAHGASGSSPDE